MRLRHEMHEQEMGTLQELRQPRRTKGLSKEMKAPKPDTAELSVEVFYHPRGTLLIIEYDGVVIRLNRNEAFKLYGDLRSKLAEMPTPVRARR